MALRYNQLDNRLYIDMDWENDLDVDEYLIIDCYRKLNFLLHLQMYLMTYGSRDTQHKNLNYNGISKLVEVCFVTMICGVSLNGNEIMQQADYRQIIN